MTVSGRKNRIDRFTALTWDDLDAWAGGRIVSRGRSYRRSGAVTELAVTADGRLIAWVKGTRRYAVRVDIPRRGRPKSSCTCPYGMACKHAVAAILEFIERMKSGAAVPDADQNDERLLLLDRGAIDELDDREGPLPPAMAAKDIGAILSGKSRRQLEEIVMEIAGSHPDIARELAERERLASGDVHPLVKRLSREIRALSAEPAWSNSWNDEGSLPDYSGVRAGLAMLLEAGRADAALALGGELLTHGGRQIEESNDEGQTAAEIGSCLPVIVKALEKSALDDTGKLFWAVEAVLSDHFNICEPLAAWLHRPHPRSAWQDLADRLLERLGQNRTRGGADDPGSLPDRGVVVTWTIHALERAGRGEEIIPLCEAEMRKPGGYERLVERLMAAGRLDEAERRIHEGIKALGESLPRVTSRLRLQFQAMRVRRRDWPAVASLTVEDFIRYPSDRAFAACRKAANRVKLWTQVREGLLSYLETGSPPWMQPGWPLPPSGLAAPPPGRERFPMIEDLIDIAIMEEQPDQVLRWYDRRIRASHGYFPGSGEDRVAQAVKDHAPERAVAIWRELSEGLIAETKPSAYLEAAKFLRRAGDVMTGSGRRDEWTRYMSGLKEKNVRKRRLLEILDGLDGKPILRRGR
jgi:uncharacterized Zn finger protein